MRLLVCGGRKYNDRAHLDRVLDSMHAARPVTRLIHGDATGVDRMAADWARSRIGPDNVDPYPAAWSDTSHPDAVIRWNTYGKPYDAKAGHRRNARMLMLGCPDLVVAFPGGVGTADMIAAARRSGVRVEMITVDMEIA